MSQYSEMMGSFIRTGNYPLEANYIFPTEEALKEFYSDKLNATTIHKGLLRIVENDGTGKQGLYWVTKKQTNDELEFTKLISGTNIDSIFEQLEDLENRLTEEIKNRKDSETAIWGTNDPTNIPDELNSLLDLATVIVGIKDEITKIHKELVDSDDSIYKSLKTEVKALAGTQEYDVVEYLKTLPYKSLTEVATALNKFLNEVDETSNQINTLPELKFFLEGYNDKQKLRHVLLDLQAEILGNPLPTQDFRTLRAIEDFVRILKSDSESADRNLQTELNQTQIGVGLNADGSYSADQETYYLKDATSIMNALKILDALMYEAISGITIEPENNDVVDLAVRKELEGYMVSAKLKLSNQLGNDLVKKDDGLYFNVDSTYKDGTLSILVNGKVVAQHVLGFSSLVDSAKYDPSQEAIVIVFKLLSGDKQTITIPVGALIREWDVDNAQPGKVIELTRTTVLDGQDTLSADVRLWADKSNILKKYGNTLGVEGTSENITHNSETLKVFLDNLKNTVISNTTQINTFENALKLQKQELLQEIHLVSDDIDDKIDGKADQSEIDSIKAKADDAVQKVSEEIIRATQKEGELQASLTSQMADANSKINKNAADIQSLEVEVSKELATKVGSVQLEQVSELSWNLIVDGANIGQINVPDDQFLESVSVVNGATLRFVFKTKNGTTTTDINIEDIILDALAELESKVNEKAPIHSPTFTGIPQIEVSPDPTDSSQRIPTTNWVRARIQEEISKVSIGNFYTKAEIAEMMAKKADLIDGKIPESQLPKLYIIEVE